MWQIPPTTVSRNGLNRKPFSFFKLKAYTTHFYAVVGLVTNNPDAVVKRVAICFTLPVGDNTNRG